MKAYRGSIPVLLGPTATGKTSLLILIAETFPIEVISCDSRQVYRGMPVGTAQPDAEMLKRVPHHLVGFLSPAEKFSAGEFRKVCNELIPQILNRGRTPVICGGTGFYFRALTTEMIDLIDDKDLRSAVHAMDHLERLAHLRAKDPDSLCEPNESAGSGRVHPNDKYRVERALYLFLLTGNPLRSYYDAGFRKREDLSFTGVWLDMETEPWEVQIRERAIQMIDQGFTQEAVEVFQRFGDCPALQTPGYREALDCDSGTLTRQELEERLIRSHLQYGRRQRVWLRRENSLQKVIGADSAVRILENLLDSGIPG